MKGYLPDIHRLLPQSGDAEQGAISSFLLAPHEVGRLLDEKRVTKAWFHIEAHATIFDEAMFLWRERMPMDFITLTQHLRDAKKLDQVGGPAFVTDLFTFLPTAANAEYYIGIIEEKYTLRQIIDTCTEYSARSYDEQGEVSALLEEVEQRIRIICQRRYEPTQRRPNVGRIAEDIFTEWQQGEREKLFGESTGFTSIDEVIGGVMPGDQIVISGGTSSGKTSFAMAIEAVFLTRGARVLDNTFEMDAKQKVKRLLQMSARVNLRETMTAQREIDDRNEFRLKNAVERIKAMRFEIYDKRGATMRQLMSHAINLHNESPLGLVVIDYDELINGERARGETRETELARISSESKTLAGLLKCPVILLSQETEDDKGRLKPRGSKGKINDANVWLRIHTDQAADKDGYEVKLVTVMKQRDGARGAEVPLWFHGPTTTFLEQK